MEYGFHGSPGHHAPLTSPRRKGRRVLLVAMAIVAVVAVGGVSAAVYRQSNPVAATPASVFEQALSNGLATKSYTQVNAASEGRNVNFKYDVSDVARPKMSGSMSLGTGVNATTLSGFDDGTDSFIRGSLLSQVEDPPEGVDWIKLRLGDQYPSELMENEVAKALTLPLFGIASDARYGVGGDFVFGNFSQSDRQRLLGFIQQKNIYAFDEASVVKEQLDGRDVYKYDLTIDRPGLKGLNDEVSKIAGIDMDFLDLLSLEDKSSKTTAYIGIEDARLYKVVTESATITETAQYSAYDATVIGTAPTTTFTWNQLVSE